MLKPTRTVVATAFAAVATVIRGLTFRSRLGSGVLVMLLVSVGHGSMQPVAAADAQFSLAAIPVQTPVQAGELAAYTLEYSCASTTSNCEGVEATVTLPPNTDLDSLTTNAHIDSWRDNGDGTVSIKFKSPLLAGTTGQLTLTAKTKNYVTPDGTQLTLGMRSTGSNVDPASATSAPVVVEARAQLQTEKFVVPAGDVAPGSTVTYRVQACNPRAGQTGNLGVTSVDMSDVLPAGVQYVSSTGGGTYDPASRTVTWPTQPAFPDGWPSIIACGAGAPWPGNYYEVRVQVPIDAVQGTVLVNTATSEGKAVGDVVVPPSSDTKQSVVGPPAAVGTFAKAAITQERDDISNGKPVVEGEAFAWMLVAETSGSNVPVDVVLDETFPQGFVVPALDPWLRPPPPPGDLVLSFARNLNISVQYATTTNPALRMAGAKCTYDTGDGYCMNAFNLAPGERINRLRIELPQVPPQRNTIKLFGSSDGNYAPLNGSRPMQNCMTMELNGTPMGRDCADVKIVRSYDPWIDISTDQSTVPASQRFRANIPFSNVGYDPQPMDEPVLTLELPPGVSPAPDAPTAYQLKDINGNPIPADYSVESRPDGRKLLLWKLQNPLPPTKNHRSFLGTLEVPLTVDPGTVPGDYPLTVYISDAKTPLPEPYCSYVIYPDDYPLRDKAGKFFSPTPHADGPACSASTKIVVPSQAALAVGKEVKGANDRDWHRPPSVANTAPGGPFSYRLTLDNGGNSAVQSIVGYDVLPHPGDTGTVTKRPRGSEWTPQFARVGNITGLSGFDPSNVAVGYATVGNPCMPELGIVANCAQNAFSPTPPADPSTVKVLRFTLPGPIGSTQGARIELNLRATADAPAGKTAWNSAAVGGEANGQPLLPTEGPEVGIEIEAEPPPTPSTSTTTTTPPGPTTTTTTPTPPTSTPPRPPTNSRSLARTGATIVPIGGAAALMILAGLALTRAARRRSTIDSRR